MNSLTDSTPPCACKCKQRQPAWKRLCGVVLITFACIALLRAFNAPQKAPEPTAEPPAGETAVSQGPVLFYFHGTRRCPTCTRMEQMARAVLDERFSGAPAGARIPLQCVNVDLPENQHYVKDFSLTMRTFVLSEGPRFVVLDQSWQLAHNEAAFKDYLTRALSDFTAREAHP